MTKSDLIDALASDTGLTKADADRFLKSFTSNVEKALKRGDSLTLIGLVRVIQVRIILKINFIDIKFLKPILAGLMTYFILFFLKPYILGYHTLATLSIAVSITLLLFGLLIWLMGIEEEDKDFLRGLGVLKESITIK